MPTILMDLDGVVFNILERWLRNYNALTGEGIQPENITEFGIHKFVKRPEIIYTEQVINDNDMMFCEFYPNAKEAIEKMMKIGMKIIFVTSTFYWCRISRTERLINEFGDVEICYLKDKSVIKGDYIIDDYEKNLIDSLNENPHIITVLVNQLWNKNCQAHIRVNDLMEFYEYLKIYRYGE